MSPLPYPFRDALTLAFGMMAVAYIALLLVLLASCAPPDDPNRPIQEEWCRDNGYTTTTTTAEVAP